MVAPVWIGWPQPPSQASCLGAVDFTSSTLQSGQRIAERAPLEGRCAEAAFLAESGWLPSAAGWPADIPVSSRTEPRLAGGEGNSISTSAVVANIAVPVQLFQAGNERHERAVAPMLKQRRDDIVHRHGCLHLFGCVACGTRAAHPQPRELNLRTVARNLLSGMHRHGTRATRSKLRSPWRRQGRVCSPRRRGRCAPQSCTTSLF